MGLLDDRIGGTLMAKKTNYGKFYKGKKSSGNRGTKLPKGLKPNPGKRSAGDTVYHDTDADRTQWKRDDGNGQLPSDWGNRE